MTRRQRRSTLWALFIGASVSAAVCAAYWAGGLERLELITLDWRFRNCNSITPAPGIVCVDIGDRDLETIGRWPWPRTTQAGLLAAIHEAGARAILVDLTYSEAEPYRGELPVDADLLLDPSDLTPSMLAPVWPDLELSRAIHAAGRVYLAFHTYPWNLEQSPIFDELVDAVAANDAPRQAALVDALESRANELAPGGGASGLGALPRARLTALLERSPELSPSAALEQLNLPPAQAALAQNGYPRCLHAALQRYLRGWRSADPARAKLPASEQLREAYEAIASKPFDWQTPLRSALSLALRETLGYQATTARPLLNSGAGVPPKVAPAVDAIDPVYFLHASAAARCGFANFESDIDGVVRRLNLLARHGNAVFTQLAFTLACDELGVDESRVEYGPGQLVLQPPGREVVRIQLDAHGHALIPWTPERQWWRQIGEHIPARAVLTIDETRRMIARNLARMREETQAVRGDAFFEDGASYLQDVEALEAQRRTLAALRDSGHERDAAALAPILDQLEQDLAKREQEGFARLRAAAGARESDPARRDTLQSLLGRLDALAPYAAANERLEADLAETMPELRRRLEGKLVLVGYTATSLADMKPIPTHKSAPGVLAHANLLSGLLTGQTVRWWPDWANALLAFGLGMASSAASATSRPRVALVATAVLAAALVAVCGLLAFHQARLWIALTPGLLAIVLSYAAIGGFRYFFIEGERRQLATALSQYTSKEMARQMAENPELCQRAEAREVTAMFTDLRGFTTISERIGAERTQKTLNVCLGRFTEVMLRHEAMVNKFIGDGVFAFWNPVIHPQVDHALRACETAIDLVAALAELKAEQRASSGDPIFAELHIRIGIATGQAVVGPCGSEQKYDYTCIGDSVNVAARLESANKFYGTTTLVGGLTREQVGERFVFRALGRVQVKGKRQASPIYELLGRPGQVAPEILEYAERFDALIERFQQRQWKETLEGFNALAALRPDDDAAQRYVEASANYLIKPPGDDWNGAIELTEK